MERQILILRRVLAILVVAIFHLATSIYFVATSFIDAMTGFDTGASLTAAQRFNDIMARILTFPLVWLFDLLPNSTWESSALPPLVFTLNSLLWGAVVYFGFRWLNKVLRARRAPQPESPAPNS